jgi:DNA repair protein RadC
MTMSLKSGLEGVGISLKDHIIISDTEHYSFAEKSFIMKNIDKY